MPRAGRTSDPVLARLRKICLSLPGAEEFVSFGHPGWRVEGQGFAFYEEYKGERCIVFKAELPDQQALVKSPRFFAAPYIGKKGWTSLRCSTQLDWKEIADLVKRSWRLAGASRNRRLAKQSRRLAAASKNRRLAKRTQRPAAASKNRRLVKRTHRLAKVSGN